MIPVIVESPFAGKTAEECDRNQAYLNACLKDCYLRGESPYASHAIGPRCLDDNVPAEREIGIKADFIWRRLSEKTVVYADLGISNGMEEGIKDAKKVNGHNIEYRKLGGIWSQCIGTSGRVCRTAPNNNHCIHWWNNEHACCFCGTSCGGIG